jgi:hypothetical protein
MLVIERGWSSNRYEDWLGEAIARELLSQPGNAKTSGPARRGRAPNRSGLA